MSFCARFHALYPIKFQRLEGWFSHVPFHFDIKITVNQSITKQQIKYRLNVTGNTLSNISIHQNMAKAFYIKKIIIKIYNYMKYILKIIKMWNIRKSKGFKRRYM